MVVRYSGTSLVKYRSVETNEGFYGVIHGINPDYKINSIRVEWQGTSLSYMVKVPKESYFTIVNQLPSDIESQTFADLYLYDKNQEELSLSN